jgi:hypothetical protein
MYTVYDSPSDFPGRFVVREFAIRRGVAEPVATGRVFFANGLEGARLVIRKISAADACLARSPEDPPSIVETWV